MTASRDAQNGMICLYHFIRACCKQDMYSAVQLPAQHLSNIVLFIYKDISNTEQLTCHWAQLPRLPEERWTAGRVYWNSAVARPSDEPPLHHVPLKSQSRQGYTYVACDSADPELRCRPCCFLKIKRSKTTLRLCIQTDNLIRAKEKSYVAQPVQSSLCECPHCESNISMESGRNIIQTKKTTTKKIAFPVTATSNNSGNLEQRRSRADLAMTFQNKSMPTKFNDS